MSPVLVEFQELEAQLLIDMFDSELRKSNTLGRTIVSNLRKRVQDAILASPEWQEKARIGARKPMDLSGHPVGHEPKGDTVTIKPSPPETGWGKVFIKAENLVVGDHILGNWDHISRVEEVSVGRQFVNIKLQELRKRGSIELAPNGRPFRSRLAIGDELFVRTPRPSNA